MFAFCSIFYFVYSEKTGHVKQNADVLHSASRALSHTHTHTHTALSVEGGPAIRNFDEPCRRLTLRRVLSGDSGHRTQDQHLNNITSSCQSVQSAERSTARTLGPVSLLLAFSLLTWDSAMSALSSASSISCCSLRSFPKWLFACSS